MLIGGLVAVVACLVVIVLVMHSRKGGKGG